MIRPAVCLLALLALSTAAARGAPATHLVVSNHGCLIEACPPISPPPPTVVRAGDPLGVYVAAHDAGNGRDILYTGTVTFSSSDPAATLPSPYTFVLADEGGKAFTVVLRTVGQQTITVADVSGSIAPGTLIMTVTGDGLQSAAVPALTPSMLVVLAVLLGCVGLWLLRP